MLGTVNLVKNIWLERSWTIEEDLVPSVFWNDRKPSYLLNPYLCASGLMHFFSCSKKLRCAVSGRHYSEPLLLKVRRTSDSGVFSLMGFPHHVCSSNLRWYPRRGSIKTTHGEGLQRNCLSGMTELLYTWPHRGCGCLHKTAQDQAIPHSRLEVRGTHELSATNWAADGSCWLRGRKGPFTSGVRPLSGHPCSRTVSGCPYAYAPTGSTNLIQWL